MIIEFSNKKENIILATGQNTILGVDYTLQREKFIKQALEYGDALSYLLHLLEKADQE